MDKKRRATRLLNEYAHTVAEVRHIRAMLRDGVFYVNSSTVSEYGTRLYAARDPVWVNFCIREKWNARLQLSIDRLNEIDRAARQCSFTLNEELVLDAWLGGDPPKDIADDLDLTTARVRQIKLILISKIAAQMTADAAKNEKEGEYAHV